MDNHTNRAKRWPRHCAGLALALAVLLLSGAASVLAQDTQDAGAPQTLTLKQAVELALSNSRDLKLARLRYGVYQREAGVARSVFRPNLYTGTGIAYTSGFPLLEGGGAPAIFSLTYNQQIFNPPLKGAQHAAEDRARGEQYSIDGVKNQVMVRAALAYLELAKVRHSVELVQAERLSADRILQTTRERAAAGRELPIEVTRAELTSAKIEQRMAQFEDRDDALSGELRDMMGLPGDQPFDVSTQDIPSTAVDATQTLVSEALSNNVDLKIAETEKKAREDKLKGERGGYWPTVGVVGQYNVLSQINGYTDFFNKFQRNNFIFGLQVQIPIFASRTKSAVAYARADLDAADLALQNKRAELSLDVRKQARKVHEADLGQEVARLELKLAQENVGILQAQFDQGRGSLQDLESAHLDENDKWLAFLDANYARQQAELNLLETTGQLSKVLQ